jgi:hypothetical protein
MLRLKIHPEIRGRARQILEDQKFLISVDRVEVVLDPSCTKRQRSNVLTDSKYFKWLSEEQVRNPPSWAKFFGLVEDVPHYELVEIPKQTVYVGGKGPVNL